ncbi:MAG: Xanthine/uracil/thiamine/ascorbate permease family protein [uncultured Nocardioidaceae bacterium]|uniref:Xanthine/uracil/thiamine/ascorbate permease family protein n=1 Tax=uncultured Nocardioidaceae bacterium TaxID=253824 RepID=A0A6J4LJX6_9ACTN|nr:MAG: Xanthine/uracil/thiamine/ascorbate permease family protein [uncultured Nocardioidaceae bacterium]
MDQFFRITERGSTVGREVRGGIVTFFTMAYIIVLNPLIIGTVQDGSGRFLGGSTESPDIPLVALATAVVAGVMTLLMGVMARYPLALATGLGLNAFVTYSIATRYTWTEAMTFVFLEGVIILLLVLTGFRVAVFRAVPGSLKTAISVGIGLFITIIGLVDAGFVRRTGTGPVPVELGIGGNLDGWPTLVFAIGLLLVIGLYARGVKGAILVSILLTTVLAVVVEALTDTGPSFVSPDETNPQGWNLNVPDVPSDVIADLGTFGDLWRLSIFDDVSGLGSTLGSYDAAAFIAIALLVFTLLLADFFDTMGTMTAIGAEGDLLDAEGMPPKTESILVVDSLAAMAGGAASVSSNTSYIESASGVGEGARTGLASVVTGVLFLVATIFTPLVSIIPNEAATPALVLVGFLMMQQVRHIDWGDLEVAIPAFLTIVLMPFTYSITAGIGAGFISYVFLKLVLGKGRQVPGLMALVAALFVVYFAIEPIRSLLGVG